MRERTGDYRYDGSFHTVSAGAQLAAVAAGSASLLAASGVSLARGNRGAAALTGAFGVELIATAASYIYATRSGKFRVWGRILDDLRLGGDETVLDLGCGRGAVLLAAAKRMPRGRAAGLPSRTCGRRVSMPRVCVHWVGEMCGAATSDGACGTAGRGFPRDW